MTLALRAATVADMELLYSWRNEPSVREGSFTQEMIAMDDHRRWLDRKLADRDATRIWILMANDVPAGQIRYEATSKGRADISFSIDARFRGRGLGATILEMSLESACAELDVHEVRGLVKPDNAASIASFRRAGFRQEGQITVEGQPAIVFSRECGQLH